MIATLCYTILDFPVSMTGGSIRWSRLLILHDNTAILILDIINKMKQNENFIFKNLYNVHNSFNRNKQKLETCQLFIGRIMDKWTETIYT